MIAKGSPLLHKERSGILRFVISGNHVEWHARNSPPYVIIGQHKKYHTSHTFLDELFLLHSISPYEFVQIVFR